jgi:peptidoglycan/LPS O-acetylase OafA/YrhL
MLECLSAATLVVLVAYRPTAGLFDPLDFQVCRFYGRISFSFYLLHTVGILFADRALALLDFPLSALPIVAATILLTLASILITTPAAYLSWRFIEVPAINFSKNTGLDWFGQRLRPDRKRLKHPFRYQPQSEPVAAHGMGAVVLSAGDTAGEPDGPPIADAALTPARVHRESF